MRIAFYNKQPRLFNKLICWKMRGPYSHVEVVLDDAGEGWAICASASYMDGGVRTTTIQLNSGNWDVIEVPGIDVSTVKAWFDSHKGAPYDTRGLFNFVIPVGHSPEGWFCDEAVLASLGVQEPWRFEPNSVARICELMGGKWITPVTK